MPRNACRECRTRKAKCTFERLGERCERCADRNLSCSLAANGPRLSPIRSNKWPNSHSAEAAPGVSSMRPIAPMLSRQPNAFSATLPGSVFSTPDYVIGNGTPGEILREAEFSKDICRLFFENYSEINFLFDQATFMRDFDLGEVPQVIIYPMMALGISFSDAPCFEGTKAFHRGEPLAQHGRRLLKDEFDHVALRSIQAYILQCTYWLVFGAARKAWLYLGIASTMAKSLWLLHSSSQQAVHRSDTCRRIVCNLALLDRILSPSFNMQCYFPLTERLAEPESWAAPSSPSSAGIPLGQPSLLQSGILCSNILRLSGLLCGITTYHRSDKGPHLLADYERQHIDWGTRLRGELAYSSALFENTRDRGTLRRFLFMHLLHNHIGQLLYFPALGTDNGEYSISTNNVTSRAALCQYYAGRVSNIVEEAWLKGGIAVHNTCCGQMLTISAVVHMYTCLSSDSAAPKAAARASIDVILQSFSRMKRQGRIFDRMLVQLHTFFQLFSNSNTSAHVFTNQTGLLARMMHYGTGFERLQRSNPYDSPNSQGTMGSAATPLSQQEAAAAPLEDSQSLDWMMAGNDSTGYNLESFNWVFTEASLQELYCMAYMDPDPLMPNAWA